MLLVWLTFAGNFLGVGMYVANRASDKITQLTDNVYLCRSGSVLKFPLYNIVMFCILSNI